MQAAADHAAGVPSDPRTQLTAPQRVYESVWTPRCEGRAGWHVFADDAPQLDRAAICAPAGAPTRATTCEAVMKPAAAVAAVVACGRACGASCCIPTTNRGLRPARLRCGAQPGLGAGLPPSCPSQLRTPCASSPPSARGVGRAARQQRATAQSLSSASASACGFPRPRGCPGRPSPDHWDPRTSRLEAVLPLGLPGVALRPALLLARVNSPSHKRRANKVCLTSPVVSRGVAHVTTCAHVRSRR